MKSKVSRKIATVDAVLRTGHENSSGESPVRIRVTYDRRSMYYPVNVDGPLYMAPAEWHIICQSKVRKDRKQIKEAIEKAKADATSARDRITDNDHPFTFDRFEAEFLTQESKRGFLKIFSDHLEDLRKEGRIGTRNSYKSAHHALVNFRGGEYNNKGVEIKPGRELSTLDLTVSMLKDFETHLKKNGSGRNTIAIYMRALRVVYNLCISSNPSLAEFYPFAKKQNDKGKYKIKTGAGKKGQALTVEQIRAFSKLKTKPGFPEHDAKLLWMFSFYCQGMNFRDMALLKYSNISGEVISYIRQKTRETESEEQSIDIPLTDTIREIIWALGNSDKRPGSYVFGVLDKNTDPEHQDALIKQKIKTSNKWLKRLCRVNKLPEITTYWARHSYASLLKDAGESIEMIRELLGHSDTRTTEAYLNRFDIDRKRKVNERIHDILKAS